MAESSELIRREIEATRADLDAQLARLTEAAERAVDVGGHLSARPWVTIASGAAVGFFLGLGRSDPRSSRNGTGDPARDAALRRSALASRLTAHLLAPVLDVVASAALLRLANVVRDFARDAGTRQSELDFGPRRTVR